MINKIDHFAIGAASLEEGVGYLKRLLGVEVPKGGKHEAMSTHNCVMQAGNNSFLEVLSIDPDAPEPGRTRWFTLDEPITQKRIAERPRPLCWVINTDDLDGIIESSPIDLGEVVLFTRGDRSWRLTVPADGHLPEDGLLPAFIEWSPGAHPSSGMSDLGITLEKIVLSHPDPEALKTILNTLNIEDLAHVNQGQKSLQFELGTPNGPVTLK